MLMRMTKVEFVGSYFLSCLMSEYGDLYNGSYDLVNLIQHPSCLVCM
jgi:hypothetical protein